jgi:hypothetical protein
MWVGPEKRKLFYVSFQSVNLRANGVDMRRHIGPFITIRGLSGSLLFLIVGVFLLYTEHSRMGAVEKLINIGILFVLMPAACLWINRKPDFTSASSTAILTRNRPKTTSLSFLSILLIVGFAESLFRSWFYPLGILLLIAASTLSLADRFWSIRKESLKIE